MHSCFGKRFRTLPRHARRRWVGFMKSLKTPITTAALLTTKILSISLKYACSAVVLTGSPNNISSGISRKSSCSPKADPFLGRCQQSMGAHRRTPKRRLGYRRTYGLASRLRERAEYTRDGSEAQVGAHASVRFHHRSLPVSQH